MAKLPRPLNMGAIDLQMAQVLVNNYKGLLTQMDKQLQEFKAQVVADLTRLRDEVPELKARLRISDDDYEIMEPEPKS